MIGAIEQGRKIIRQETARLAEKQPLNVTVRGCFLLIECMKPGEAKISYAPMGHETRASPRALHFANPSSSGASLTITLSAASVMPFSAQRPSQVRIHSPSPQP